jgi:hypothetical protein
MDRQRSPSPHPSSARHTSVPIVSSNAQEVNLNLATTTAPSQPSFDTSFDFASGSQSLFPDQHFSPGDTSTANFESSQSSAFPSFDFDTAASITDPSFDAPLFANNDNQTFSDAVALDPALLGTQVSQQTISADNNFNQMATLAPSLQRHTSSPHGSPLMGGAPFQATGPSHSRHNSLDPSSAAYPMHGNDWNGGGAFQGHRRNFSDAHSDVSSAQHSPFMPPSDNFEQPLDHSPHLGTQDPALFQDVLAIGQVSLSESVPAYISPAQSPHISPRLPPTQHSPQPYPVENFSLLPGMPQSMPNQFSDPMNSMYSNATYPSSGQEPFPTLNRGGGPPEMPGSNQPTPDIKIQLAPPTRQPTFENDNGNMHDSTALSPPEKSNSINILVCRIC